MKCICEVCGESFSRGGGGRFCNKTCMGKAFSGSANPMYGKRVTEEQKQKRIDSLHRNGTYLKGPKHPQWRGGRFLHTEGYVLLTDVETGKVLREHRKVAEEHFGVKLTSDMHVHHKDGNKANNDPANLEILTIHQHRQLHAMRGTDNPKHKLNEEQVAYIRSCDLKPKVLAERFGVSRALIGLVRRGRIWRHVP